MPVLEHPQQSLRELPPFPGARSHLSCAWIRSVSSAGPPYSHRVLANGSVELSADLGSGRLTVSGPRQRPRHLSLAPGTTLVGVRFRLGAASELLGVSASELIDEDVELADVWGHAADDLASKIHSSTSAEEAARLLAHAIAVRGSEAAGVDPLVLESVTRLRPGGVRSVQQLCSMLFVSERQLRRRLVAALGFGPKTLQRNLRFRGFLALTDGAESSGLELGRVASMLGYADQPHLTRECVAFTLLSPRQFLAEDSAACPCEPRSYRSDVGAEPDGCSIAC
jgi:AraC-like DNA-binding protein